MKWEIVNENNAIVLQYRKPDDVDYWNSLNIIEDEYLPNDKKAIMYMMSNEKSFKKYEQRVIFPKAHRHFYNSHELYLNELLWNLKTIVKKYGEYWILNYNFSGIHVDENDEMAHVIFDAEEEDFGEDYKFNLKLLGKPFKELVKVLKNQKKGFGNIAISRFRIELFANKKVKPKRRRTHIPRGMRHEVFKRDNYTCVECGARKEDGATLHIDHKIPVSKGGTDELDNLQTLCSDCNLNKSDVIQ